VKLEKAVAGLVGLFFVAFGFWSFIKPSSFYAQIAGFGSYNRHFLHDIGAFQIGIGATLLLAALWNDALGVALAGAGLGSVFHAVAHWWDRHLGGRASDPYVLTALAAVLVAAALARRRSTG